MGRQVRTREETMAARREFFGWLLKDMSRPASEIDSVFAEAENFDPPIADRVGLEPEHGTLWMPCSVKTRGEPMEMGYSVFHCGSALRVALLSRDARFRDVLELDTSSALESVWPGNRPYEVRRGEWTLIEWGFDDLDILESYIQQEKYVLGVRSLHMRFSSLAKQIG